MEEGFKWEKQRRGKGTEDKKSKKQVSEERLDGERKIKKERKKARSLEEDKLGEESKNSK